jgi:hypothetical protein
MKGLFFAILLANLASCGVEVDAYKTNRRRDTDNVSCQEYNINKCIAINSQQYGYQYARQMCTTQYGGQCN